MPQIQNSLEEEKPIAGQLTYFNILAQSIQRVNDAIMQDKDARDAAENLISDLPRSWQQEIHNDLVIEGEKYNKAISYWNQYLVTGSSGKTKSNAHYQQYLAGKAYSRSIKNMVISLLQEKDLLYQTKNKVEHGALSLYELTGQKPEDDNDI